jgi:DNA-binding CsgD family transcriptional regulator
MLVDRHTEKRAVDGVLSRARAGFGAALVIHGTSGTGKTTLLEFAESRADGCLVLHAAGAESEVDLDFAGVQQLCRPIAGQAAELPEPQRRAICVAFGEEDGSVESEYLVALGVLNILADAAEHRPVVCLIDDAHWLDRASLVALGFVARRVEAEGVALIFVARDSAAPSELKGIPAITVGPLDPASARRLFDNVVPGTIDPDVRDLLLGELAGNPLAIRELVYGVSLEEAAGGFGLPVARSVVPRLEAGYEQRLAELPAETRRLLLLAAADATGDLALVERAASGCSTSLAAAAPAERARLLRIDDAIRFAHPMVRGVVYRSSTLTERCAAHAALAAATDPEEAPERRAWHLARAATMPDAELAGDLELLADRALRRGGPAAAAAFHERASELSPDRRLRAARLLAAAGARLDAGLADGAQALLERVDRSRLGRRDRAHARLLDAEVCVTSSTRREAVDGLLEAADGLAAIDPALACRTYLAALEAAVVAGPRLRGGIARVAHACAGAPLPEAPGAGDLLLEGVVLRFTEGPRGSHATIRDALERLADDGEVPWLNLAIRAGLDVWEPAIADRLSAARVRLARSSGQLRQMPDALAYQAMAGTVREDGLHRADQLADEAASVSTALGLEPMPYPELALAAWRGDQQRFNEAAEAAHRFAQSRGDGSVLSYADGQAALLYNGLGHHQLAHEAARRALKGDQLGSCSAMPELIEAATRIGDTRRAGRTLDRLLDGTAGLEGRYGGAMADRCKALVTGGVDACVLFERSSAVMGEQGLVGEQARTELLWGEALRREGRRREARVHLRSAHDSFAALGAKAFAARARAELAASGERARRRVPETRDDLTPQEARIARLARDGRSNPEIAGQLFLSRRTVEYHLQKVYAKLGVGSRQELASVLPDEGTETAAEPV